MNKKEPKGAQSGSGARCGSNRRPPIARVRAAPADTKRLSLLLALASNTAPAAPRQSRAAPAPARAQREPLSPGPASEGKETSRLCGATPVARAAHSLAAACPAQCPPGRPEALEAASWAQRRPAATEATIHREGCAATQENQVLVVGRPRGGARRWEMSLSAEPPAPREDWQAPAICWPSSPPCG